MNVGTVRIRAWIKRHDEDQQKLSALTRPQKQMVLHRYRRGMSPAEIALKLSVDVAETISYLRACGYDSEEWIRGEGFEPPSSRFKAERPAD